MKKFFTLWIALMAVTFVYGQAVQRNQVVLEIGTGTWCTYCPGAANGAHDLLLNGCHVAVIENHNGDAFANSYSNARNSYYNITGFPTANFDGISPYVGGQACPSGNVYAAYLPLYNARYAVLSPLLVDVSGTNSGNTYNIVVSIKKLATITSTDLRLQFVLTESNITTAPWPGSGGCMTKVDHVNRIMVPDENGTAISFTSGDMQIVNLTFTLDGAWVPANCELVAFLQDFAGHEVLNGTKVALLSLPLPVSVDFTGTPVSGCAPLNVGFTDQSVAVTNWQWALPGGTPSSSTTQNPAVTYNTAGTFDATLTAWNNTTNRGNKKVRTAYLTINAAPAAPGTPTGPNSLCSNPGIQVYTTSGAPGATSYNWDLTPVSAGTITNNGTSCSVNWNSAYTGTATLKVQGINSCGTGVWSSPLTITLNLQPSQAGTPTGPFQLCINSSNTDYTTTGATPATSYVWDLTPTTAGIVNYNWTNATIDWANTYTGTAQLKVSAMNGGCQGPWSASLNITVYSLPLAYSVTGGGNYCATGGSGLPVGVSSSEVNVNYTLYLNGNATTNIVPGTGNAISFGNQTVAGTYTVVAGINGADCLTNMNGNAVIAVDPQIPNVPGTPVGSMYPESGSVVNYTTAGGPYATSYSWLVTPANAGIFTGNTTTGTITWSSSFTGPATIQVKGINSCGESGVSSLNVDVVAVGMPEASDQKLISIYPNPAKGFLNIVPIRTYIADIQVTNYLGTSVISLKGVTLTSNYKLDISKLSSGIYFITTTVNGTQQITKIVVE